MNLLVKNFVLGVRRLLTCSPCRRLLRTCIRWAFKDDPATLVEVFRDALDKDRLTDSLRAHDVLQTTVLRSPGLTAALLKAPSFRERARANCAFVRDILQSPVALECLKREPDLLISFVDSNTMCGAVLRATQLRHEIVHSPSFRSMLLCDDSWLGHFVTEQQALATLSRRTDAIKKLLAFPATRDALAGEPRVLLEVVGHTEIIRYVAKNAGMLETLFREVASAETDLPAGTVQSIAGCLVEGGLDAAVLLACSKNADLMSNLLSAAPTRAFVEAEPARILPLLKADTVRHEIARDQELINGFLEDESVIQALAVSQSLWRHVLTNFVALRHAIPLDDLLRAVIDHPRCLASAVLREEFVDAVSALGDPCADLVAAILRRAPVVFLQLAAETPFFDQLVDDTSLLSRIADSDAFGEYAKVNAASLQAVLPRDSLVNAFLADPEAQTQALVDTAFVDTVAANGRVLAQAIAGGHLRHYTKERPDSLRNQLSPEALMSALASGIEVIQAMPAPMAEALLQELCKKVRVSALSDILAERPALTETLIADDRLAEIAADVERVTWRVYRSGRMATYIEDDPEPLMAVLSKPPVLNVVCADRSFLCELFEQDNVRHVLLSDPDIFRGLLSSHDVSANHGTVLAGLQLLMEQEWVWDFILSDRRLLERVLGSPRICERIATDPRNLSHLLSYLRRHAEESDAVWTLPRQEGLEDTGLALGQLTKVPMLTDFAHVLTDIVMAASRAQHHGGFMAEVLDRFVSHPETARRISESDALMKALLATPRAHDTILATPFLLDRILASDCALERIVENGWLLTNVLRSEQAATRLAGDPGLIAEALNHPVIAAKVVISDTLQTRLLQTAGVVEHIVASLETLDEILAHPRTFTRILETPPLRAKLVSHNVTIEALLSDSRALQRCLRDERAQNMTVSDGWLIRQLVKNETTIGELLADRAFRALAVRSKPFADYILVNRLESDPEILRNLPVDGALIELLCSNEAYLQQLLRNRRLVQAVQACEPMMSHLAAGWLGAQRSQLEGAIGRPAFADAVATHPQIARNILAALPLESNAKLGAAAKARIEAHNALSCLAPFFNIDSSPENLAAATRSVDAPEAVSETILQMLCPGNALKLKVGDVKFPDRRALWVLLNELFVDEEYFFTAGTDAPFVIDCGANCGLATCYFKHLYPNCSILAFEPEPRMFDLAQKNITSCGFSDVQILPYALAPRSGTRVFYVSKSDALAGSLTTRRKHFGDEMRKIKVEAKRLSTYIQPRTDLLKIDIEGTEDVVLQEVGDQLKNVHYIVCEYHHGAGLPSMRLKRICTTLEDAGFRVTIGKSWWSRLKTSHRPLSFARVPYSGLVFAENERWS